MSVEEKYDAMNTLAQFIAHYAGEELGVELDAVMLAASEDGKTAILLHVDRELGPVNTARMFEALSESIRDFVSKGN